MHDSELNREQGAPSTGRLSDFLRSRRDAIIASSTERVRALSPSREASDLAIVDHLPQIIARMADVVEAVHSGQRASLADLPRAHALDRLARGFDLNEVVREYAILRRCIFDLWANEIGSVIDVDEAARLNLAIDAAVEEAAVRFANARSRRSIGFRKQLSARATSTLSWESCFARPYCPPNPPTPPP